MYGKLKYDSAPHTAHHISTSPTSYAKSCSKKATGGKEIQMVRLVPLDLVPHRRSAQLPLVAWIHRDCGHVPIDLDRSYPTSIALQILSMLQ
jgi:hypothetical protein